MGVTSVLIAGVGGQGVLLAGSVLAEAALLAGRDVKVSEVHGMAQRGGSVVSGVRFGGKVFSPVVGIGGCDLIIGLEPLECARYLHYLKDGGAVVYSTRRIAALGVFAGAGAGEYPADIAGVIASRVKKALAVDACALAGAAGDARAQNMVLLGAAVRYLPLEAGDMMKSLRRNVPTAALAANMRAFRAGLTS